MDKRIRQFYEGTISDELSDNKNEDVPITHLKVFHKEYPRLPQVPLIGVAEKNGLEQLLQRRSSVREFSNVPLALEELSALFLSCSIVDAHRDPERRTYPSAGARFPVELYLAAFNVDKLDCGVYHYNMVRKTLELLWGQDLCDRTEKIVSPYLRHPAAAIIFTSIIARSEVKYGLKSYSYSLIEAGHMAQNIHLTATHHGIGTCSVGGFANKVIQEMLDITTDEIPIYVMGVGNI